MFRLGHLYGRKIRKFCLPHGLQTYEFRKPDVTRGLKESYNNQEGADTNISKINAACNSQATFHKSDVTRGLEELCNNQKRADTNTSKINHACHSQATMEDPERNSIFLKNANYIFKYENCIARMKQLKTYMIQDINQMPEWAD